MLTRTDSNQRPARLCIHPVPGAHPRRMGVLLFSDADHKTVADHLRWLVFVDQPGGKPCHLNLSDPPVANALFGLHPAHNDNRLFGLLKAFMPQTLSRNAGYITSATASLSLTTHKAFIA
ncbi:DUF4123 domain-containing protein [Pseudomonas syringae pv. actinidiae]|nr:DUF4123 domain-containing protein [Pseudomonas syringae pv. actinidiae]